MLNISKEDISRMEKEIMREFPDDPALRQVHLARRIISEIAKRENKSIIEVIHSFQ